MGPAETADPSAALEARKDEVGRYLSQAGANLTDRGCSDPSAAALRAQADAASVELGDSRDQLRQAIRDGSDVRAAARHTKRARLSVMLATAAAERAETEAAADVVAGAEGVLRHSR